MSESDFEIKNYGVGGETVETILGRMGAYPMMVMPNGAVSNEDPEEPDNPTPTITITKNLSDNIIASLNDTVTLTTVVSGATSYQWQTATEASFTNHTNIEGGSGTVNADGIVELEITVSNDDINKYYRCFFANSDGGTLVTATTKVVQIILKDENEDVPPEEEEGSIIYWGDDNRFGPTAAPGL
jgi:hypothetical protein